MKNKDEMIADIWGHPMSIEKSGFKYKSLSESNLNVAVGCSHSCRFCYVGQMLNKQKKALAKYGVEDPDSQWGNYSFIRPLDEEVFLKSLKKAEETPIDELSKDGHRAVMLSTTTDAYQTIRHSDRAKQKELQEQLRTNVRRALELILTESTLNVRILTRSPLAEGDFDLYKRFVNRLLFGMSLPSLNNKLVRKYEPNAPAPSQRLKTLKKAKKAGLNIYVAVAPTFPECDEADLRATLEEVKKLDPLTIFHEPINIRGQNVERMADRMEQEGESLEMKSFVTDKAWVDYAVGQLRLVEKIANEIGVGDKLHLWPDKDLLMEKYFKHVNDPYKFIKWLNKWHNRISAWAK